MPEFTVSEFSYIATSEVRLKSGRTKKCKHKAPYAHYKDYYLSLRTAIKGLFKHQRSFSDLRAVAEKAHEDKKGNYKKVAENFINWASGKNIYHYDPPRRNFSFSRTDVVCNPELYYKLDGQDTMLKLHFNASQRMNQQRANYICFLMSAACDVDISTCRVLDLSDRKEYSFRGNTDTFQSGVESEIRRIESEWDAL